MNSYGKGVLGALALISGTSAISVGTSRTSYNRNNPIAKSWLSDNHFFRKADEKFADFEKDSNINFFALGCHRAILGEKNFKRLYNDSNITTPTEQDTSSSSVKPELPISDLFINTNEPLLGCSTAHLKVESGKKIYQYELALRQGDKGFDERISIHEDKIVSQLVFFEKNQQNDPSQKPTYKHLFGLYRYIKQSHKSSSDNKKIYKIANPNTTVSSTENWSELDLSTGNNETQARYYAFWVDDSNGKGIFDNLGVKSNDKLFSSVAKGQDSSSTGTSKFVYAGSKDAQGDLQAPSNPLIHYDLSVLDSLINKIHGRKGSWKSAKEFCSSIELTDDGRQPLSEVQRLSQYCYEIKAKTAPANQTS